MLFDPGLCLCLLSSINCPPPPPQHVCHISDVSSSSIYEASNVRWWGWNRGVWNMKRGYISWIQSAADRWAELNICVQGNTLTHTHTYTHVRAAYTTAYTNPAGSDSSPAAHLLAQQQPPILSENVGNKPQCEISSIVQIIQLFHSALSCVAIFWLIDRSSVGFTTWRTWNLSLSEVCRPLIQPLPLWQQLYGSESSR